MFFLKIDKRIAFNDDDDDDDDEDDDVLTGLTKFVVVESIKR